MDLKTYLSPMPAEKREEFAHRCGTTKGHLQNVMYGTKTLDAKTCVLVEAESGGQVTRQEIRPDWQDIWPELADPSGAGDLGTYLGERVAFMSSERMPLRLAPGDDRYVTVNEADRPATPQSPPPAPQARAGAESVPPAPASELLLAGKE